VPDLELDGEDLSGDEVLKATGPELAGLARYRDSA